MTRELGLYLSIKHLRGYWYIRTTHDDGFRQITWLGDPPDNRKEIEACLP